MLTTIIHIIPENVIMSLTNDSDVFSSDIVLQNNIRRKNITIIC